MLRITQLCVRFKSSQPSLLNEAIERVTTSCHPFASLTHPGRGYSSSPSTSSQSWNPNILRSPLPDVELPKVPFYEFLWSRNDSWSNEVGLVCGVTGQQLTFGEFRIRSQRFAQSLLNQVGLGPGQVLALILPNMIEFPSIVYGCQEAGVIPTLISYHSTAEEISYFLKMSEAKAVVTFPGKLPELEKAIQIVKDSSKAGATELKVILTGNSTPSSAFFYYENLLKNESNHKLIPRSFDPDETIALPYSSGTTGLPKGVCLTNKNLVANQIAMEASSVQRLASEGEREVVPLILPMYHIYGLAVLSLNIRMGTKTVLLPKLEQNTLLRSFTEHKASILYSATPLILYLLNNAAFGATEMSSIQKIYNAASPLSASDMDRLISKMKRPIIFGQAYGLTETSPMCAITGEGSTHNDFGSVGLPAINTRIKVMDLETKQSLTSNEIGEICVKGPQVMKGYLKNEEETNAAIDSEGWYHTGDLGYYNENHSLYITGRLKELIKVKGLQVAPAEVEGALQAHPNVASAGVVGKPDDFKGETPVAFVVVKNEKEFNAEDIREFLTGKLAGYKIPSEIIPIKDMPVSNTGKILKRELKKLL